MTSKEKAEELIAKYMVHSIGNDNTAKKYWEEVKQELNII